MLDGPDDPRDLPPSVLDAFLRPDDVAAWARTVTPGSLSVKPMAVIDPARLSAAGRVDALVVWERELAWVQAQQLRTLAAMADEQFTDQPAPQLDKQWVKEDVRCALQKSAVDANDLLQLSTYLTHTLPATLTALEQGRITLKHARVLCELTLTMSVELARAVEAEALPANELGASPACGGVSVATFRRRVHRAVTRQDPEAARARQEQKVKERKVAVYPDVDGMGTLSAFLSAPELQIVSAALDVIADSYGADDPRTRDQRRADAPPHAGGTPRCRWRSTPSTDAGTARTVTRTVRTATATLTGIAMLMVQVPRVPAARSRWCRSQWRCPRC